MAINEHGLDVSYFNENLKRITQNLERYTPAEITQELVKIAALANSNPIPTINSIYWVHFTTDDGHELKLQIDAPCLNKAISLSKEATQKMEQNWEYSHCDNCYQMTWTMQTPPLNITAETNHK